MSSGFENMNEGDQRGPYSGVDGSPPLYSTGEACNNGGEPTEAASLVQHNPAEMIGTQQVIMVEDSDGDLDLDPDLYGEEC